MGISIPLCLLPPWSPGGMQRTSVHHAGVPRLARPGRPYGLGAHRAMCVRARAAYSYGLSNLIYNHHPSTPVCGRLWPPPKIIFRPGSAPEAGGRPLGSGHRPNYFFDFPRNSSGRFICMGDNDLTTKRPNRAQLGRFRFSRNSTQAIALRYLRAFRAFLWL